jgi:hypothetical protein
MLVFFYFMQFSLGNLRFVFARDNHLILCYGCSFLHFFGACSSFLRSLTRSLRRLLDQARLHGDRACHQGLRHLPF